MRIGLAGAGRIGALHARTLAAVPEVTRLLVADTDVRRAGRLAADCGAESVARVEDLFSAHLDGLVIATATAAHAELITAAVRAGLPVFCEKPVAGDIEGALAVRALAGDVPVQVGFQRRFDIGYRTARDIVRSGRLGWVHTMRAGTLDPTPPSAEYVASSGGLFRDCGVHDFDIVRWVSGRDVVEVFATGANRGADYFVDAGDVDAACALLTLDDGTLVQVVAGRYNARGYDVRLEVLGAKDSICVGLDDSLPLRSVEPDVTFPARAPYTGFLQRFAAAYVAEMEHFVAVVAGRASPRCTVEDALEAMYVAEACERSRAEHRLVTIAEVRG